MKTNILVDGEFIGTYRSFMASFFLPKLIMAATRCSMVTMSPSNFTSP